MTLLQPSIDKDMIAGIPPGQKVLFCQVRQTPLWKTANKMIQIKSFKSKPLQDQCSPRAALKPIRGHNQAFLGPRPMTPGVGSMLHHGSL